MKDRGFGRRIAMFALFIPLLAALSWGIGAPPVAAGTDAEDVAAAVSALTESDISFAAGDSKDSVTQDFTVPTTGLNDTTIDWVIVNADAVDDWIFLPSDTSVIIARPTHVDGDQVVQLRATVSKGGASDTKDLQVTLKATTQAEEDAAAVADDLAALDGTSFGYAGDDGKDRVTQNFTVPLTGSSGTTITYTITSDPLGNVSLAGDTVSVSRPSDSQGNQTVTFTAAVSKGEQQDSKEIEVVIKALPGSVPEAGDIVTFAGVDWLCVGAGTSDGYKLLRLEHAGSEMAFTDHSQLDHISNGADTLVKGTDWNWSGWGIEYEVTIYASYLATQPTGVISLSFVYSGGFTNTLAITSTGTLSPSNAISLPSATFIDQDECREDLTTDIIAYGHNLTSVTNGAATLVADTDYALSGSRLTVKKEYLEAQSGDSLVLTLNFDGGNAVDFAIDLRDTSLPDGSLNPAVANYAQDQPANVTIKVTEDYYYDPDANNYKVSNPRAYLNGEFYDAFTPAQQSLIRTATWNCGSEADESSATVTGRVGLLTKSEMDDLSTKSWYVADGSNSWWLMTPYSSLTAEMWYVGDFGTGGSVNWCLADETTCTVRPALYLRPFVSFEYVDSKYVVSEDAACILWYPLVLQRGSLE